ncbi:MAG: methyltransferase domain-containing protein, partial [Candidatus Promineifilaceae bacterium]|nr:methyltransferase domain-containing protein [Candidatus Promineifilaceae bacterium]
YVGVDFSARLLARARAAIPSGTFYMRDIGEPAALHGLGTFCAVASLAVLQHIPGRERRVRVLRELRHHLAPGGRLFLSTWQFMQSERQRRKIAAWGAADIDPAAVEPHDYLLTWQSGGFGLRYVCYIDREEMAHLAADAGLVLVHYFRSDGREGNLNLYGILERRSEAAGNVNETLTHHNNYAATGTI